MTMTAPQTDGVADHAAATYPVEPKVRAATAAASTAAGILVPLVLWLLGTYVFHGDVPFELQSSIGLALTGACTFAAGWAARHVDRVPAGS